MGNERGQHSSVGVFPFFCQYEVQPARDNAAYGKLAGAIATVMVFAKSSEQARARAGRHVGRNNWEIHEVKRTMLIRQHHVDHMEGTLRAVYRQAEQAGIAATFDGWQKVSSRSAREERGTGAGHHSPNSPGNS